MFTTDNLTIEVEGWSTGIALVDRGINLNEIIIRAGTEVTTTGRYDARCNRSAQTERIANRNHPLADAALFVRKGNIGEFGFGIDLKHCQIRLGICSDQTRVHFFTIIGDDREFRSTIDDMIVGNDVAIIGYEETGSLGNTKLS